MMLKTTYFLNLIMLLSHIYCIQNGFAANIHLTIKNVRSAFSNYNLYQCYPSEIDTTITFGKVFNISSNDSLTEVSGVNVGGCIGAKAAEIPFDGGFFGVYYCKGVVNGETAIVKTTIVDQKDNFNCEYEV
ncbi:uncharacterized protein LOC117117922 [Anneissia japonica]|uniref:uncharacterized protein LOC117117922 n=1 Tax=Anneissia japonica TaxID=1529436 RepID=UPI00142588FF|nr:uncharacterized protein LOC117117922 [Anneissia japonica]